MILKLYRNEKYMTHSEKINLDIINLYFIYSYYIKYEIKHIKFIIEVYDKY